MAKSGSVCITLFVSLALISVFASGASAWNITEFDITTPSSGPQGITAGPDGALWFTEAIGNIGMITPEYPPFLQEYPIPSGTGVPMGITAGPDGNIWFAENNGSYSNNNKIGKVITATGIITEYTPSGYESGNLGITAGPVADGALWFTHYSRIGRITTDGTITGHDLTLGSHPEGIAAGSDGALWFANYSGGSIGRITTGGVITYFTLPLFAISPMAITAGPDDALWFTTNASKIGKVTTAGVFTFYDVPGDLGLQKHGITQGPDGAVWFVIGGSNKIGRITTFGSVTEYEIPTASSWPSAITAGPDGAIWFTEYAANKIGRLSFLNHLIKTTVTAIGGSNTVTCNPNPVMESTASLCSITPSYGYHVYDVLAGDLGSASPVDTTSYYYFNNVNVDKDIQAGFELNDIRLYHGDSLWMTYQTIQEALNDLSLVQADDWVKVIPGAYVEGAGITVNRPDNITFTLSGGWNYAFDAYAIAGTMTMIAGSLTIEGTGGLIIDRIAIQ